MRAVGISTSSTPGGTRFGRELLTWVLIAGFLLQPVLAYLVTPIVAHDGKGRQVVVCTLQGSKLVTLELPPLADNDDTEHCAALKLYQIAGTAQVSQPPETPVLALYAVQLLEQIPVHQRHALHVSVYATRAPPVV